MFLQPLKAKAITLLRSTEQYTKTDMVYLTKNGLWSLGGQGVGSFCSFIVVAILANTISKESFGEYRFMLSAISVLTIFSLPGVGTAIMRSVAQKKKIDLISIVQTKITYGLIGSLAAILIALYYLYKGNFEVIPDFILIAAFLPFIEPFYVYWSYFKGKHDFKTPAIYESYSRFFQTILLIIVALTTKSILLVLVAYLIGQIIARYYFYRKTLKDEGLLVSSEEALINSKDVVVYGRQLSLTQAVAIVIANIDKFFVWHFFGAEILAMYYVVLTIPNNIILLCNIIPRVSFPKLAENSWELPERNKILRKFLLFFCALIIPALLYFLLVPLVFPLIFKDYSISKATIVTLMFLILLSPLNAMIGQILQVRKFVKKIIFSQVFTSLTFIVSFLVIYKNFGISVTGAAVALVISEAVALATGIIFIK